MRHLAVVVSLTDEAGVDPLKRAADTLRNVSDQLWNGATEGRVRDAGGGVVGFFSVLEAWGDN